MYFNHFELKSIILYGLIMLQLSSKYFNKHSSQLSKLVIKTYKDKNMYYVELCKGFKKSLV